MVYYEMKKIFSKTSGRIAVICLIGLLIVVCGFAVSGVSYMNEQGEKEMKRKKVRRNKTRQTMSGMLKIIRRKEIWQEPFMKESQNS